MAANAIFGAGHNGLINPPNRDRTFVLCEACIAVFDRDCYDLLMDLSILHDLAKHLSDDSSRAYESLLTANEIINQCDPFDHDTFAKCHEIAQSFFSQKGGTHRFTISAIANCHIDCAWLWPYGETIRKCARSWSSTIRLMEDYPDLIFVASQAQQFEWVKDNYPGLYSRIQEKAAAGRFIPVGGTWVEMDGNIPSGESFIRQFLVGQRFFKAEFGSYCKEFWLPDTFGYSAQLPQIMKSAGIQHFLTQKLSWNLTNKFPVR
jgi:alpha-mannosidase